MIIDFFEILRQGKISIISIEENNLMINIKNLNLTLKAPLSLLAPAISGMLSKKYYETWYWDIDVKDKVVVDVGAYIGDSALFFVSRGAKIVYAYEPSKELYVIAMKNCSRYGNIILHNFGLGCSEKYAFLTGFGPALSVNELAQDGEKVLLKSFNEELRKIKPKIVVETGVSFGVTSSFILQAMEENGFGTLYSIDLPFEFTTKEEVGIIVPKRLRHRWELILGDGKIELPRLLKDLDSIDVFFHDSRHTYEHMMFEYKTAWPKIRKDGILISDDIHLNNSFIDFCRAVKMQTYYTFSKSWYNSEII